MGIKIVNPEKETFAGESLDPLIRGIGRFAGTPLRPLLILSRKILGKIVIISLETLVEAKTAIEGKGG